MENLLPVCKTCTKVGLATLKYFKIKKATLKAAFILNVLNYYFLIILSTSPFCNCNK